MCIVFVNHVVLLPTYCVFHSVFLSGPGQYGVCNGSETFASPEGIYMQSAGYPNGYKNNSNCTWSVNLTTVSSLTLTFVDIQLNTSNSLCSEDYIIVDHFNLSGGLNSIR